MKLRLAFALVALSVWMSSFSADLTDETLHYVITYKWGLIQKDAGDATLSLRNEGPKFMMKLTARTKPWADKIFHVRDTLVSVVMREGFQPESYSKTAHEDGKFSLDKIVYSRHDNVTLATTTRIREKEGKFVSSSGRLSASGLAFDMLSVFYYIRTLDFAAMKPGAQIAVTIFSGKRSERLTITCRGRERISTRKRGKIDAYHLSFRFTTDGGRRSSDEMQAWLSADDEKIPVQLTGSLPIGQVRACLL